MTDEYIYDQYVNHGKSPAAIARAIGSYANGVRRRLKKMGVVLRDRAASQKLAIEQGRHPHPTKGRRHTAETRRRIGETVARAYQAASPEEKERRRANARERWRAMSEEKKDGLLRLAWAAVRQVRGTGSKLKHFLINGLTEAGYDVVPDGETAGLRVPQRRVTVFVNGVAHYEPVWGEEALARAREADAALHETCRARGDAVVVVKNLADSASEAKFRGCLTTLFCMLEYTLDATRVHEVEVR